MADTKDLVPRVAMLDVWMALGGEPHIFEQWIDDPNRTSADTWAQLMAAIRGDHMWGDHNPEPGAILDLVRFAPQVEPHGV